MQFLHSNMRGGSKTKVVNTNRRRLSFFSAFTEFLARNVHHRDMRSVLFQLASHQPETNFSTLRVQRSFAVQAEDIQVLLQVRRNRVHRVYETLMSLVLLAGGALTAFCNNGKTYVGET